MPCRLSVGADFTSSTTCFVLEGSETEIARAVPPIHQIFADEFFEVAASLALSNMNQLMEQQLAVPPTIRANDNPMSNGDSAGRVGNDLRAPRGFCQFLVVRKWNSVYDENADPISMPDPGLLCVRRLIRGEWSAMLKDVGFLGLGPLPGQRGEASEFFFVNHHGRVVRSVLSTPRARTIRRL